MISQPFCQALVVLLGCLCGLASSKFDDFEHRYGLKFQDDYNRALMPPGGKRNILLGFDVKDITEVNDFEYTVTLSMAIYLRWNDSRIKVVRGHYRNEAMSHYPLDSEIADWLWKPPISIENVHRIEDLPTLTQGSKKSQTVYVANTETEADTFQLEMHKTITITCPMNFKPFPFDDHICFFEASFGAAKTEIEHRYLSSIGQQNWGRFQLGTILEYEITLSELPQKRVNRNVTLFTGEKKEISYAGFQMVIKRKPTTYLINYYLPSALFVIVSWATFVIEVDSVPGRMALIITALLALINIANSAFSNSPGSNGINLIQIWIITCLLFVFVTVGEYFILLYYSRYIKGLRLKKQKREQQQRIYSTLSSGSSTTSLDMSRTFQKKKLNMKLVKVDVPIPIWSYEKSDRLCLIFIPPLFIIFNGIYWYFALA